MIKKLLIILTVSLISQIASADAILGKVNGMICMACQDKIQNSLKKAAGKDVNFIVSWPDAIAVVNLDDGNQFSPEDFTKVVTNAGFQVEKVGKIEGTVNTLEEGLAKLKEL